MRRFLLIALLLTFCLSVKAGTLQGLAVEIHDGKTLSVENAGRRIKVVLKSADVPEADQPYADVARQHLSDLVLGKAVTVEYMGLAPGAVFIAKVYCGDRDISLQMIRDGVAWFTERDASDLSDADRAMFTEAEQAARIERRGLWQDPNAVAPWEWRRAKAASSVQQTQHVFRANTERAAAYPPRTAARSSEAIWPVFAPPNGRFSVRMPGGGEGFEGSIQVPHREPIDAHFYGVRHLKINYLVIWASGPSDGETVKSLFDKALDALNEAQANAHLPCEFREERDAAMSGFTGRRYTVHGCVFQGGVRLYFKSEGQLIRMYFVGVMSQEPNDPRVREFLESFEIH